MEVLDFAGPYEVFNVAGDPSTPPGAFHLVTVGVTPDPVGRGGFCVRPDHLLKDAPHLDILVIPGGAGSRSVMKDRDILSWVRDRHLNAELTLTVCTGAFDRRLGRAPCRAAPPTTVLMRILPRSAGRLATTSELMWPVGGAGGALQ
jgi:hypothetical protein